MAQMPMVYSPPSTGWPFTWLQGIVSLEKSPLEQYIYGTSIPSQTLHNWKTINGLVGNYMLKGGVSSTYMKKMVRI